MRSIRNAIRYPPKAPRKAPADSGSVGDWAGDALTPETSERAAVQVLKAHILIGIAIVYNLPTTANSTCPPVVADVFL